MYEGRTLSAWLEGYDVWGPGVSHTNIDEAVRQMGTDTLPHLLKLLQAKDSYPKLVINRILSKQRLFTCRFTPAERLHSRALAAFQVLGTSAKAALPDLVTINQRHNHGYVMSAMAGFDKDAEIALVRELTNRTSEIREYAVYLLGSGSYDSAIVISALGKSLRDEQPEVRRYAAISLGRLAKHPAVAVPALGTALANESDDKVKEAIIYAVASYGTYGPEVRPEIEKALHSTNPEIRSAAAFCLR